MSTKPNLPCVCGATRKPNKPCEACGDGARMRSPQAMAAERYRPNSNGRGYTYRWREYSIDFRRRYPLCQDCHEQPSAVVDHIVPHRGDYELFWAKDNHQALCEACHNRKTGRGE